jgi:hypothetical protein
VYMLATQQGVFPSENHRSLGQRLEALKRNKPLPYCDTIKKNNRGKKILSDMIIRLWLGLGVPENTVDHYIDEIKRTDLPKHAWPVGVIDPTGKLRHNLIFFMAFVVPFVLFLIQHILRFYVKRLPSSGTYLCHRTPHSTGRKTKTTPKRFYHPIAMCKS